MQNIDILFQDVIVLNTYSPGISYSELNRWIKSKIDSEGGSWKVFMANPEVIQFAHVQSCSLYRRNNTVLKKKVIGIDDFRTFLVHFYAISILWVHFKNADEFTFSNDFGNLKLSFEEFKLAVKTLTSTHEKEVLSDEQLMEDFVKLDHDKSNSLGFVEVCTPPDMMHLRFWRCFSLLRIDFFFVHAGMCTLLQVH